MKQYIIAFLTLLTLAISCKPVKDKNVIEEAENISLDITIKHLESDLFNFKSTQDVQNFFARHPMLAKTYFKANGDETEEDVLEFIYTHFSNKQLFEFYQYTISEFEDLSEIKNDLERFLKYTKYFYTNYHIPEFNTLVTGFRFDNDMVFSDSLVVVSIDYFLGDNSPFRPPYYEYMLARYKKPYLVPMIALGISNKFNKTNLKDESMLANMIYYGKAHYFLERTIPGIADSLNIMYSAEQLKNVEENADLIWAHFVNKQLLFDTSPRLVEKYVGESPKINEIGEKCPGRIGRWLGWQIVRKYMEENPQVSLQELMAENDAQKIFRLSRFKPKK